MPFQKNAEGVLKMYHGISSILSTRPTLQRPVERQFSMQRYLAFGWLLKVVDFDVFIPPQKRTQNPPNKHKQARFYGLFS